MTQGSNMIHYYVFMVLITTLKYWILYHILHVSRRCKASVFMSHIPPTQTQQTYLHPVAKCQTVTYLAVSLHDVVHRKWALDQFDADINVWKLQPSFKFCWFSFYANSSSVCHITWFLTQRRSKRPRHSEVKF